MGRETSVIDVAVNHLYSEDSDLVEYLPEGYAERFMEYGQPLVGVRGLGNSAGFGALCSGFDAEQTVELTATSPPDIVQQTLFDHTDIALLTGSQPFYAPNSMPNKDYGNALCRAYNEYTIERWLETDERFVYTMTVNHQDPEAAAEEIHRIGASPQIVGVNLSPRTERPFGNKKYDPIFEAITETGLVLTLCPTHGRAGIHDHPPTPAGYPQHESERQAIQHTQVQAHLQSLVFEGTFEKFPALTIAAIGWGWSWLPGYLWRLDSEWKNLHTEIPWVEHPPSEYINEHVRFDLHGVTNIASDTYIETVFEWINGPDLLLYGSDFPRKPSTDPDVILPSLSSTARRKILSENAAELFNLA